MITVLKMIFHSSINYDPKTMLRVTYEMTCGMAKRVPVPRSTWLEPGTPIGRVDPIPPIGFMKT